MRLPRWTWEAARVAGLEPGETPEDAHTSLVHTLGNLTLTGCNSSLSNHEFAAERRQLAAGSVLTNQGIVAHEKWGREQIHARAAALAARIVELWPGPDDAATASVETPWDRMTRALSALPAGRWTIYGDLTALIGSHALPVGQRLATVPVPNAHRVLQVDGSVAESFAWIDPLERTTRGPCWNRKGWSST